MVCFSGFVLLYLQFYVYVLQMLFVYSGDRVTLSLVLCVCFVDVVCVQWGSCYSIFSFMCMFCRCCLCIVRFVLLDLQFYVYVLQMLFVYSEVRVTRSLVLCVMFCRCCLCIVGFVLLDLQFYVYVLQMLFVHSGVRVTRSLVLCVCFVDRFFLSLLYFFFWSSSCLFFFDIWILITSYVSSYHKLNLLPHVILGPTHIPSPTHQALVMSLSLLVVPASHVYCSIIPMGNDVCLLSPS